MGDQKRRASERERRAAVGSRERITPGVTEPKRERILGNRKAVSSAKGTRRMTTWKAIGLGRP